MVSIWCDIKTALDDTSDEKSLCFLCVLLCRGGSWCSIHEYLKIEKWDAARWTQEWSWSCLVHPLLTLDYAKLCQIPLQPPLDSTAHKRVSKPTGFKITSSEDCQNSQFWCTSNFGTRLGGSLAPKWVSKPMVFKMASSGDFRRLI